MYFLASKIIGFFVVPSNLVPTLLICGLLLWCTRYARAGKRLCVVSIVLLLLVSGLPVGTALLLPLENRFQPWDPAHGPPTGIIVLGGAISPEISVSRSEVSLNSASERLFAVVELYLRYPNLRIVYSGGNANIVFGGPPESRFAVQLLERLGIPRDRIECEGSSRNTMENAINVAQIAAPKPGERWLLITSAYHMPRAIGLFRKSGFPIEAYPVDWQTGGWADIMTPSFSLAGGFANLDLATHEWVGLIFDRLSGRTSILFPEA
jgi:uncharacterized SAM-binding protein YcdF (DUF218 family)